MQTYALLIRGINVGKKNSLPMATLKSMLSEAKCKHVSTYVQSGNAVFLSDRNPEDLSQIIEQSISDYMGRTVGVTLRTSKEWEQVMIQNPLSDLTTMPTKLCVTFLSQIPTETELAPLRLNRPLDWGAERWALIGRELYTHHPDGQSRSPLAVALGKCKFRGTATTRNWNTVSAMWTLLQKTSNL